jgi:glutamate synthase (NADPH/NADH) large chain
MTGGTAVILGPVGANFGAGMTGGMAFVYDPEARFSVMVNNESVVWQQIATEHWANTLKTLVTEHVTETHSVFAEALLADWDRELPNFVQVVPREMLTRLAYPLGWDQDEKARA